MAKPRKPRNEGAKPDDSGAVVRHQKLCLSIDIDKRQIYGYTELEIVVPDIGFVGLYAENLGLESVFVDGEPTEFEYYPHQQNAENGKKWKTSVSDPSSAADAASASYLCALQRERVPNLLINCCKAFRASNEPEQIISDNGLQCSSEAKQQNVKLVRINYWVEKMETGIHFYDNVLHSHNQIRRGRCWFPCMDEGFQRCCYDLEFTVAQNLVAVSAGTLLYTVLSEDEPPRKTYVYRLEVPVMARWISLAVAPFEIFPDPEIDLVSHLCLPSCLSQLRNSVHFFHNAFKYYEDYLDIKFPFGSYTQLFLAPEMVITSSSLGAAMSIFSSQLLYDEKVIDQTIDTCIKLSFSLARQWFGIYIAAEEPSDEWLLDGLAGFLTDLFIKKFLGNNEARYRRYKANCAVCKAEDPVITLSSSASCKDLYGTHNIGLYGKLRSWKSVTVLQMLEKQMGPESFRRILQKIVSRAGEAVPVRSLSTKEVTCYFFRHFATKVGNLERPFVKEFFARWVSSCGSPVLRIGFSYNKRKNIVELAVLRECTVVQESNTSMLNVDGENRDADLGWPGMMSIRIHEFDGMYDHPVLPLSGDTWQLLEIPCHSRGSGRRFQKPKKGSKPEGSDENGDIPVVERTSSESPFSWIRADPEMEYLAEIHLNQPVPMWINQLEKDEDVVAQSQAIMALSSLPHLPFSVVNAMNNLLSDSKVFWRVRIEAAFALANSACEETDWAGFQHLVKYYKSRRFDATIGLPKSNDFHDFAEYFVLQAIPHAVSMVRTVDKKSPREAVEFVLQLLKYNDNSGNPYSDVFWLAALVQSVGELEFGQQSMCCLSSLLKSINRLLQYDRLMPSYNGILTVSCIQTLSQIAIKLSESVHLDLVLELIRPFRETASIWQVRIEASRALLALEFHCRGIDSAFSLVRKYLEEEPSLRGQTKLSAHVLRLCQLRDGSKSNNDVNTATLVNLLELLEGPIGYNNIHLRHHVFSILHVLAGRYPTLYGVPRDKTLCVGDAETCSEQKNIFAALLTDNTERQPPGEMSNQCDTGIVAYEASKVAVADALYNNDDEHHLDLSIPVQENSKEPCVVPSDQEQKLENVVPEVSKDVGSLSNNHERKKPVVKIRLRRSAASSRADTADNQTVEIQQGDHHETDYGPTSSISVDAPAARNSVEAAASMSNQNVEEVNSCMDRGSRMTASIGSAKHANEAETSRKELQCTADSSKVSVRAQPDDTWSPSSVKDNNVDPEAQRFGSLQNLLVGRVEGSEGGSSRKGKEKKKDKEKKRKRDGDKGKKDDPEYLERKRLKKEKKKEKKEKEVAKLIGEQQKVVSYSGELSKKLEETNDPTSVNVGGATRMEPSSQGGGGGVTWAPPQSVGTTSAPRFKIRIKSKTLNNS
ncbi:Transcription initiation factor TFIID subunit 2 [Linum perenne]